MLNPYLPDVCGKDSNLGTGSYNGNFDGSVS